MIDWAVSSGFYETVGWLVPIGEVVVGALLILGLFTGIAAFVGVVMNFSYMFTGSAGVNPLYAILGILLVLSWRNAGYYGLDRWVLPAIGMPWAPGWVWRRGGPDRREERDEGAEERTREA